MIPNHNNITVDLKKVAYAFKYYVTPDGLTQCNNKPRLPTVRGSVIPFDEMAANHPEYPSETLLQRAKRLELLDVWVFKLVLQLTNSHRLIFTGDKAKAVWKLWCAHIYGKTKSRNTSNPTATKQRSNRSGKTKA